jgi:gamma-glutamyltranspeptidase/glutathione hydrolase
VKVVPLLGALGVPGTRRDYLLSMKNWARYPAFSTVIALAENGVVISELQANSLAHYREQFIKTNGTTNLFFSTI